MNIKDCEGCITKIDEGECIWFHKDLTCPCASCLIKVMCLSRYNLLEKHTAKVYRLMRIVTLSGEIDYVMGNENEYKRL